jgi:hypothetical protein
MGTIGATETPGIGDRLAARKPGVVFADAPVPGSKDPAGQGQLLLASGPAAAAGTAGTGHPQLAGVIEGRPLGRADRRSPIADASLHNTDRRDYAPEFPWSGR